jgi:hypothetical protein
MGRPKRRRFLGGRFGLCRFVRLRVLGFNGEQFGRKLVE